MSMLARCMSAVFTRFFKRSQTIPAPSKKPKIKEKMMTTADAITICCKSNLQTELVQRGFPRKKYGENHVV
jgi:Na+-transporting methylmalonyl-CoA/oxaloacetate decarboxylase gamma subunit